MTCSTHEGEALRVLRALYDLADADVRVTRDLLERLLGLSTADVIAYVAHLRRKKLVNDARLLLTMAGLAVALNLPPTALSTTRLETSELAA